MTNAQIPRGTRPSSRRRGALAALLIVLTVTVPDGARADANAEARFYFERGNEGLARAMRSRGAARRREMQAALADYLQSLRIVRSKNTVYNLAVCYEELGQQEDAFDYFAEYLRADINDAERTEASRRLEAVRPRVAVLEVGSAPAGAQVWIDRRDLAARGTTPLSVAVPAGHHTLFVELEGYGPVQGQVDAVVGQTQQFRAGLTALPAILAIDAAGGPADVLVDGRPAGRTPLRVTLAGGAHDVRLRRLGSEELRERVELRPGEERTMRMALPPLPIAGGLAVRANVPAAQVAVDGVSWGTVSTAPRGIVPGRHTVEVSAPGYRPASVVAIVPEGRAVTVHARLNTVEPPRRYGALPVLSGISSGVALAVGAVVGLTSVGKQDDLDTIERNLEASPTQAQLEVARSEAGAVADDMDRLNTIADVAFVGAAVLGTLTVVLLATARGAETGPSTAEVADGATGPSLAEVR